MEGAIKGATAFAKIFAGIEMKFEISGDASMGIERCLMK